MVTKQEQLLLWEASNALVLGEVGTPLDGQLDVSFLLNGFCIAGLPLRRPRDNTLVWKRQDERFALTVQSPEIGLPGGSSFIAGLPFGPKARLLAMWLATEAKDPIRRSDDRWIEIGKITDWLRAVGISPEWGPRGSVVATKDQFLRLAFAQFSMVFRREDGFQPFKHETLIEAGVFHDNDLEKVSTGAISDTKWPTGFLLSQTAFDRFRNQSIPIPTTRLRQVAHNAMAIDILTLLCYRLPLIEANSTEIITWRQLTAQFGNRGEPVYQFKDTFTDSIKLALRAYPEARVELVDAGLQLRHSDPAALRRAFIVLPGAGSRSPTGKRRPTLSAPKLRGVSTEIEREYTDPSVPRRTSLIALNSGAAGEELEQGVVEINRLMEGRTKPHTS
jgi:Plasmid encoded RepA protein